MAKHPSIHPSIHQSVFESLFCVNNAPPLLFLTLKTIHRLLLVSISLTPAPDLVDKAQQLASLCANDWNHCPNIDISWKCFILHTV